MSKDYEVLRASSEATIYIAMTCLPVSQTQFIIQCSQNAPHPARNIINKSPRKSRSRRSEKYRSGSTR
jgi:hypothetical protein